MRGTGQTTAPQALQYRVAEFIQKHHLLLPDERLVVAVSGGPDSVCLFHVLLQLQKRLALKLYVAHLNHKLRGAESDADATYVAELARKFSVPAIMETEDVTAYHKKSKGGSLEESARELRYAFFARVAKSIGASKVAVGHTKDDNVETILLHFLRGTGTAGLRGLAPLSILRPKEDKQPVTIVRPLLEVSRNETAAYCEEHKLHPRSDSSNISLKFQRNRIRLELLPLLRNYNPNIDSALLRLAAIATDDTSFLEAQADALWNGLAQEKNGTIYLETSRLAPVPPALQRQIFRKAVERLKGNIRDIEADHVEAMVSFLKKPAGKRLNLPQGLSLFSEYGRLVLTSSPLPPCPLPPLEGTFPLNIPGETTLSWWHITAAIFDSPRGEKDDFAADLDFDKCGAELIVRSRCPGDRFQPLGMAESKKLQDFMVDCKIPRTWRDRVPLVCSPTEIIWVVGWRISDSAKVTIDTRRVLHLKFRRL